MAQIPLSALRRYLLEQELMFLAGQPAVYHCHHFNLFLDQTIDDALGAEEGTRLRTRAAQEFARGLIEAVCVRAEAETPPERLQVALELFRAMGHGKLDIDADTRGGVAHGSHLHYGYAWHEKYGQRVRRRHPADAFASGFAAAALEAAFRQPFATLEATETACVAMRAPLCDITLEPTFASDRLGREIGERESAAVVGPAEDGLFEDVIQPITQGLKEFTAPVRGDERGLVQAFGVFVTLHLAGYYNRISYDAVSSVERSAPQSVGVLEDLLRESGHVCVFNTFGGILLSPEWEGLVGAPPDDPAQIVAFCMAIGRALGMGRWQVADFVPERRLVIRTSSSYESTYYRTRHGLAERPNEYLLQGAALATAQLAHRVKWSTKPKLTTEYYLELFKGGVPWRAEQTRAIVCGEPVSEIVVTRTD
jgi:hypothetical protein